MDLPEDLKTYLQQVRESNERIVATKQRQLDPNLTDEDAPWLGREQENMAAQISGYTDYFGNVERDAEGNVISGDPAAGEAAGMELFDSLVEDPAGWATWHDVIATAEHMNARIDELLAG